MQESRRDVNRCSAQTTVVDTYLGGSERTDVVGWARTNSPTTHSFSAVMILHRVCRVVFAIFPRDFFDVFFDVLLLACVVSSFFAGTPTGGTDAMTVYQVGDDVVPTPAPVPGPTPAPEATPAPTPAPVPGPEPTGEGFEELGCASDPYLGSGAPRVRCRADIEQGRERRAWTSRVAWPQLNCRLAT